MDTFYKGYTKLVQNKSYYFVKKYLSFPEYETVADILEGYGMHEDFDKACSIAGIEDDVIRKQLFNEILSATQQAKIIELNPPDSVLVRKISNDI